MISFSWPSPGLQQHCKPHYYKVAMASVDRQSKFLRIGSVRVKMKNLDSGFTLPTREARYSLKKPPGHSASLPLVRMSYRGFLVYMEYKMWLEPKVSLQSSRMHTTPVRAEIAQSQAASESRFALPWAASWPHVTTGHLQCGQCNWGDSFWTVLNLNGKKPNTYFSEWKKKPSCFQ